MVKGKGIRGEKEEAVRKGNDILWGKGQRAREGGKGRRGKEPEREHHEEVGKGRVGVEVLGEETQGKFLNGLKAQGFVKVGSGREREAEKAKGEKGKEGKGEEKKLPLLFPSLLLSHDFSPPLGFLPLLPPVRQVVKEGFFPNDFCPCHFP